MISLQIGRSLYSWIPQQYPSIPDWDVQTIDTILTMKNGIPYQALLIVCTYKEIPVFLMKSHYKKRGRPSVAVFISGIARGWYTQELKTES